MENNLCSESLCFFGTDFASGDLGFLGVEQSAMIFFLILAGDHFASKTDQSENKQISSIFHFFN